MVILLVETYLVEKVLVLKLELVVDFLGSMWGLPVTTPSFCHSDPLMVR